MKYLTAIILILILLFCYVKFIRAQVYAMDAEQITIIATEVPEKTVTISQEWEVNMTASVPANPCNICIKYQPPSQCIEACADVIIYE